MDTAAQWPQDIVVKPMEEIVTCPKPSSSLERKVKPHKEQALNCPRCNSTNTKFCYYNNYSLSQPRYFCKTCRRYWTEGGSLRNIPVGGGSRKNKRLSSSSSNSSKKLPDLVPPQQNPKTILENTQDLNLGFSVHHHNHQDYNKALTDQLQNPNSSLDLLTTSRGLNYSFMMPLMPLVTDFASGFPNLPEFKPSSLNFSLDDGLGSNYGSFQGVQETNNGNNKLLFPFEDLNKDSSSNNTNDADQQNNNGDSNGFWNGVIGGGPWSGTERME